MDQKDVEMAEQLRRIAHTRDGLMFPIMSGKVVAGSVDEAQETCAVILTAGDATGESGVESVETEGVLLNGVSLNSNGMVLYPADGSDVWVAEIDGPGKYGLVKCSELVKYSLVIGGSKIVVTGDVIEMNGGGLDGLVKVKDLVTKINALEKVINNLKTAVTAVAIATSTADGGAVKAGILAGLGAGIAPLTMQADLENPKVKHG